MKIGFIKQPGGVLVPFDDQASEKLTKFKTGEYYEADLKLTRNPKFHRKVLAFFAFCFEHWSGERVFEHCSETEQFDRFRKDLTILAGFYTQTTRLDGSTRLEAKSIAFANMEEEMFRELYTALIKASCKHIFKDASEITYNRLIGFF